MRLASIAQREALLLDAKFPVYLSALGALLTAVYRVGIILRSKHRFLGAGIDWLFVRAFYVVGITGLFIGL